jgi:NarL family two-component system response regulator LiaR
MRKTILLYSFLLAGLIGMLKFLEYRYLIRSLSIDFYIGVLAFFFTVLGIWVGSKLTKRKEIIVSIQQHQFVRNEESVRHFGISKRELEVLELIATGLSNQEIAEKMFVSLNTIKTHLSSLFVKLNVKRRTQAVQKAKSCGLIS